MTDPPPPPHSAGPPPGWYPTTPGMQGYWDGTRWTGDVAPLAGVRQNEEKTWAVLMHLSVYIGSFIGPLVVYLIKKDESPFLRQHSATALNLQISLFIYAIVSIVLMLALIGFVLILVVILVGLIYPILGAVAAGRGDEARFPGVLRFVS